MTNPNLRASFAIIPVTLETILVVSRGVPHNLFGLIGGGIEAGETEIQALIREIKEETGLIKSEDQFIEMFTAPNSLKTHMLFTCFMAKDLTPEAVELDNTFNNEGDLLRVVEHSFIYQPSNTPWPEYNKTAVTKYLSLR